MNVLLLTDFSTHAMHAHRYALELYKNQPLKSFLLHVKKPCAGTTKCSGDCKLALHQKVVDRASQLSESFPNTTCKALMVEGSFIEEVRAAVIKYNIDFLVIGAKGKSTHNKAAVGSYTHAIATKVKCPVFIVFENNFLAPSPSKILFPVNYTDALYPACLDKLKNLPNWENLEVKILELKPHTMAEHLVLSSKQIVEDNLNSKLSVTFDNKEKNQVKLIEESEGYDLLVFAAKNLSVGNQVFNELRKNKEVLPKQAPLYVLHA